MDILYTIEPLTRYRLMRKRGEGKLAVVGTFDTIAEAEAFQVEMQALEAEAAE